MSAFIIDAFEFCKSDGFREGSTPLVEMTRLAAESSEKGGDIRWTMQGGQTRHGYPSLSMADILVHVEVAHDVRDALIDRDGDFGTMLRIAELLETAVGGRKLNAELKKIGLTVPEVREIELAAFDWVRELTHDVR